MSLRRARGSRLPFKRPKRAFHSSVPGVSRPMSFLFQRGQPTSAALARSREAGTARPLISSVSVSVWKWNWLFTQARTPAGTYSSQISGGSTMWLSQSKTGNDLVVIGASCGAGTRAGRRLPRAAGLLTREALGCNGEPRERFQHLDVARHQPRTQVLGKGDELAVVGGAPGVRRQPQHVRGDDHEL